MTVDPRSQHINISGTLNNADGKTNSDLTPAVGGSSYCLWLQPFDLVQYYLSRNVIGIDLDVGPSFIDRSLFFCPGYSERYSKHTRPLSNRWHHYSVTGEGCIFRASEGLQPGLVRASVRPAAGTSASVLHD